MTNYLHKTYSTLVCLSLLLFLLSASSFAQIVTNGSFEDSEAGTIIDSLTNIKGWGFELLDGAEAEFQIVSDETYDGNNSLKVVPKVSGPDQWSTQAIADSIPVQKGITYLYSVWAKSEKAGASANFTVGKLDYSELGAIRPATLTTEWKEFTMQFTINDGTEYVRAPIHFNYVENIGNTIYIDNLQITDLYFGKSPVIVEAESGILGSDIAVYESDGVNYIATTVNNSAQDGPGDVSRIITYEVAFEDTGFYNLFARVRVGSGTFDDDSFFYGVEFGENNEVTGAEWQMVNGLGEAGFVNPDEYVDGPGVLGSEVWKWVNITKNGYQTNAGLPFHVGKDSLIQKFQIGTREDGLGFDKIAFGKSDLFYTVNYLDNGLPGTATKDSSYVYPGPQLSEGHPKFLGNAFSSNVDLNFANLWVQLTPGNAGKWGSIASTPDTSKWNWYNLDIAYDYAKENDLIFKNHTLIWGEQQPNWISDLDSSEQIQYIETWIRMVGERYPDMDMIDVVNEPLPNHNPPDGKSGKANYIDALGGYGETGWDWVIKSFELARKYMPNTKLILNEYGVINSNTNTTKYIEIIKLLQERDLIDGIGVQGHRFEFETTPTSTLKYNLDKLAATGLPTYISEMDLGNLNNTGEPDDAKQLELYKRIFPTLWEHPGVEGITLWGYNEGAMWQETCFLVNYDGTWRPAMEWLAQYIKDDLTGVSEIENSLPSEFRLDQNYPNPFNPTTTIKYSIAKNAKVSLKVFDILGREVTTLVNSEQLAGQYSVEFSAHELSSGIYFYQIIANDFTSTKKLMLLK